MRLFFILTFILSTSFSFTQSPYDSISPQLDTLIQKLIKDWKVSGISVAITVGDSNVYSRAFGFADLAQMMPATTNTIFPIGSMRKSFTAFSLALLQEQRKLSLKDNVIT